MSKKVLAPAVVLALALAAASHAYAQAPYPAKAIRIISPFPPGGSVDTVARIVAFELTKPLGQQIVVDNRSGASGNIGMELAKNAPPDGYTLVLNTMPLVTNQFLYSKAPYDPIADFAPISLISASPNVLTVHPSLPVKSVKELLALARAKPGALNYASAGPATNPHIAGELFNYLGKTNIVVVHFKGGGPGLVATLAGETQVTFSNISETVGLVQAKKLRALGVTSLKRTPLMPELPAIAETIPGYEFTTWHALLAPRGTPPAVISTISERLRAALRTPEGTKKFADRGLELIASTPGELAAHLKSEVQKWGRVIKERGMRAE
ncbi:MAG TPA: tripartite tricarboxylate transporter substrate binding protein [Burkholderiales bacterium]|nr:tripartite tricarboxylate transporter substrate binding protein [Burkholderiales bacterium]